MHISLSAGCRTQRTTLNAPVRFAWLESETHFALKAKKPGSSRPNPTKRSLKRKSCGLGGELSIAGFRIVRFLPQTDDLLAVLWALRCRSPTTFSVSDSERSRIATFDWGCCSRRIRPASIDDVVTVGGPSPAGFVAKNGRQGFASKPQRSVHSHRRQPRPPRFVAA